MMKCGKCGRAMVRQDNRNKSDICGVFMLLATSPPELSSRRKTIESSWEMPERIQVEHDDKSAEQHLQEDD